MNHENLSYDNSIHSNDKKHIWKAINKLKWDKRLEIFGKEEQETSDILDYIHEQNVRKDISMNLSSDEDEDEENESMCSSSLLNGHNSTEI